MADDDQAPQDRIDEMSAAGGFDSDSGAYLGPKEKHPAPDWLVNSLQIPGNVTAALDNATDAPKSVGRREQANAQMDKVIEDLIEQQKGISEREKQTLEEEKSGTRSMISSIEESRQRMAGMQPPTPERTPAPPSHQELAQGGMEWMQIATLIGAMGGAFIRRGSTTALNAFAGAMRGYATGRKEDFDAKIDEWKLESERVKQDNQDRLDQYNNIMKNEKQSADLKLAEFKLAASAWGDEQMYNAAESKRVDVVANLLQRQIQFKESMDDKQQAASDRATRLQAYLNQQQEKDDAAASIAQGVMDGSIPPDKKWLGNYTIGPKVESILQKNGFNLSKANFEYDIARNIVKNNSSSRMQYLQQTAEAAIGTMDDAVSLARQMRNGNIAMVNDWKAYERMHFKANSPEGQLASKYVATIVALRNDLNTLESGGWAPHAETIHQVETQLNAGMGADQLAATLQQLKRVISYRMNAIEKVQELGPEAPNRYTGETGQKREKIFGGPGSEGQVGGENADPLGLGL